MLGFPENDGQPLAEAEMREEPSMKNDFRKARVRSLREGGRLR
jgi:hypothetical protein